MPIRLPVNPTPVTGGTVSNPTPAPAPAPAPAPGPSNTVPAGWTPANLPTPVPANTGGSTFSAGNTTPVKPPPVVPVPVRPNPFNTVTVITGDPSKTLTAADKGTITQRFDHAAAAGMIKSGDVSELIRSMTATTLTDDDVAQLKTAVAKYSAQLSPADLASLNNFVNKQVPSLRHDGSSGTHEVILNWDPPTTNTDGTPLNDLAGYKVHMGPASGQYDTVIDVKDPSAAGYVVDGLTAGPRFFTVTSYDTAGRESGPSNEASKVIP